MPCGCGQPLNSPYYFATDQGYGQPDAEEEEARREFFDTNLESKDVIEGFEGGYNKSQQCMALGVLLLIIFWLFWSKRLTL